ncbi:hypothetical protein HDU67_000077 [Dinochytrium kinnereticum]|nr:hypothetical protein HDU67_000077 [Dinochytrium kinnereticum]
MAPPLQTALISFLLGILFLDASLGTYQLFPFLVSGFQDPTILRSKIPSSVRGEILTLHKTIFSSLPIWAPATIAVVYVLLLITSLLNTAIDSGRRAVHIFTMILSLAAAAPIAVRVIPGPAMTLVKGRTARLSAAMEPVALYDIGLAVGVASACLGVAFLMNLVDGGEVADAPKEDKKKKVKKTE